MRIVFVTAIAMLAALPSSAQEIHAALCLYGCPAESPASNDLVIRDIYILSSNDRTKFADWVAYRVTKATIGESEDRNWEADPLLAADETLEPDDYTGAFTALKTDRGHQAPLASFTGTPHWKDTNLLSNITPQGSALNRGPWMRLESAERALAKGATVDAVYVTTGPLYEGNFGRLPGADESHLVPSGYWKVVAVTNGSTIWVAAFIFDQNTTQSTSHCTGLTTVDEVERRSGLNLFHGLSEATQATLESAPATLANSLGCSGS